MPKSLLSPIPTRNADIPIYLDNGDEREQICQTCGISSRDHPIHCITKTTSAPPSYHSITPPSSSPRNLAVPILNLETSRRLPRVQPPRPALRFDVRSDAEGRARVRSRRSTYSPLSPVTTINDIDFGRKSYASGKSLPNTPVDDIEYIRKSKLGLGIPEAPFNPDPSPIRSPGSEKLANAEKGEFVRKRSSPNLAQGIEQKLWNYSASSNVVKRWLLEIISWLLSALCMCTIIVILVLLQNKRLPERWFMNITLNAYIAVLSRVASASLMLPVSEALGQLKWSWFQGHSKKMWDFELFDNASRGPWGSFMLLVRTKGTTLAALGAAVTIFVMAMEPFFQQVVRYPQRTVLQLQNSSIPRVTRYEPHFTKTLQAGAEVMNPDLTMSSTVDKFFFDFGSGVCADIPVFCPDSDCTWEPYETLGVCSECVDVVDMLDFGCLPAKLDWVQNATSYIPYENGTMCGWFFNSTSEERMLMLGYQVDPLTHQPSGEILTTRALPLITNISRRSLFGGSINFKHVRNPISDFVVVSTSDGPDQERVLNSVFQHQKPRALECVLSWCVKTIDSSFHGAEYTEAVTSRFINTTAGPYPWTYIEPDSSDPDDIFKIRYPQDITVDPHAPDGQGNVSSYGASNETVMSIIAIFDDYLPSFATLENNASITYLKHRTWENDPYHREFPKNPWSAPNNVTLHMEKFATVLTNIMRQSSSQTVLGKSFMEETYIEVRWVWLSLPVALLVLTCIFLLGTVIRTSVESDRVGVWKNSAIATLLYGLPDEMQQKITASQGKGTPRAKAKELNVRMLPTKDWRISGHILSPIVRKPKPPPGWI